MKHRWFVTGRSNVPAPTARTAAAVLAVLMSAAAFAGIAQTRPSDIQYTGQSSTGQAVTIPAGDKPTILLFYRPSQRQSDDALQELKKTLEGKSSIAAFLVISGPNAPERFASPYPILIDRDYALSGKMGVHAWPSTVIVNGKGDTLAHVGGISPSYGLEVSSYIAFVAGEIDQAVLDKRLASTDEVKDTSIQAAGRHLQVARKLIADSQYDAALAEVDRGLKLDPANALLKVARVRVLLAQGNTVEAKASLAQLDAASIPPGQLNLIQGLVAAASGDLERAQSLLQDATKLNPTPSEAWYELGKVCEQRKDFPKAAEAFRKAYESAK